jgi:pimeloyl-ACP methyl ester carboxylesterase
VTAPVVLLHGIESSRSTFWRVERDLADLGVVVTSLDLPGHGSRPAPPPGSRTLHGLAAAVAPEVPAGALVVGHSLGTLVALTLAAAGAPVAGLLLEEPPSLPPGVPPVEVAGDIAGDARRARVDPDGELARLLAAEPRWARSDAEHAVANHAAVDVEAALELMEGAFWDIAALIRESPAPVALLAATPGGSALTEPDRASVLEHLGSAALVVESGHGVHRDRPGVWTAAVLRMLDTLPIPTLRR